MGEPLLSVQNLQVHIPLRGRLFGPKPKVRAVDGISFDVAAGQTVALVGESGCGKTTAARSIMHLRRPTGGRILWDGEDVTHPGHDRLRALRSQMAMVFQDPFSSLSPRMTVKEILAEPIRAHGRWQSSTPDQLAELLEMVGLHREHLYRRPHEFSGGQCQRIAIARALTLSPRLLVLDEPTSALDVSVQARVLQLLHDLQGRMGLSFLFITHDLGVVRALADHVVVMYLGKVMESAPVTSLFEGPLHPYTRSLISSVPSPDPAVRLEQIVLAGHMPSAVNPPPGCPFHTRCPLAQERCSVEEPVLREVGGAQVACHLVDEV